MLLALSAPPSYCQPSQELARQPSASTERSFTTSDDVRCVIESVLAGEVNAFNHLVETYQRLAYNIAYRILQNEDAADDAVQESFIKAFRALSSFRGGCFKSWLTRIVVNTCYDMLKSRAHRFTIALDDLPQTSDGDANLVDSTVSPEAHVQHLELRQWLEQGLHSLPVDQRVVVLLFDVHGYSYEEIAEITGVPMGTVKSRVVAKGK